MGGDHADAFHRCKLDDFVQLTRIIHTLQINDYMMFRCISELDDEQTRCCPECDDLVSSGAGRKAGQSMPLLQHVCVQAKSGQTSWTDSMAISVS